MTLFRVSPAGSRLGTSYPPPDDFAAAVRSASVPERQGIIRLWLTEGIPSAFQQLPLLYESARASLASSLELPAKAVTLVGSGRIGYSLAPSPDFGRAFSANSDLDFSAVSEGLFGELQDTFAQWKLDFEAGTLKPRTAAEQQYWPENLSRLPNNLKKGFVDHYKIPYVYAAPRRIQKALYSLHVNLKQIDKAPEVSKVSLRVFRDWDALVRQTTLNLNRALVNGQA